MVDEKDDGPREFTSKLKTGRERFLAHVIEYALEIQLRTAEDFIRLFPPLDLMMGLKEEPGLRAQVLVLTTGLKHKIAVKKTAESAGEDLQIALDEGETDAESIVALFNPDDRVRFLDQDRLWHFCVENEFWKAGSSNRAEFDRAKQQTAFMLTRAIADRLVTHREIVEGIGVDELATRLPRSELSKVIELALANSHKKTAFTEKDLLTALPPDEIVRHIPLPHLFDTVLAPLAEKHGYVMKSSEQVAKALDWLDKEGKEGDAEGETASSDEETESEGPEPSSAATDEKTNQSASKEQGEDGPRGATSPQGTSGWTMPPGSDDDDDVEITDDDIHIT